jgi:co-chaperonin GroES (HSP10)
MRGKVLQWALEKQQQMAKYSCGCKAGDVGVGKYSGTEIKINGEEVVVREDDIMAVVE